MITVEQSQQLIDLAAAVVTAADNVTAKAAALATATEAATAAIAAKVAADTVLMASMSAEADAEAAAKTFIDALTPPPTAGDIALTVSLAAAVKTARLDVAAKNTIADDAAVAETTAVNAKTAAQEAKAAADAALLAAWAAIKTFVDANLGS